MFMIKATDGKCWNMELIQAIYSRATPGDVRALLLGGDRITLGAYESQKRAESVIGDIMKAMQDGFTLFDMPER